jgi:hypothetical protein
MKKPHLYVRAYLAALLMLAAVPAEAADVKELFAIDLADYPGKEGRMIEVSYQPAVTLKAGQTFYEGPTDVHVVGRNASNAKPARFVVVLLKARGAPILTPVKE